MIDPKSYPILAAAMSLKGAGGMCFHRAVALVLDDPRAVLAIGTLRAATDEEAAAIPNASRVPFLHAWAEVGEAVFAPTTIEAAGGLRPWPRGYYYSRNGVHDVTLMRRPAVLRIAEHYGYIPLLRRGRPLPPGVSFARSLLSAAGVKWTETEDGAVLPKGAE